MEAAAASAMDFHALSRRELQALCKRNGVRANMTNAAMADALQGLASIDGIDEIGTTLCLPTPGRSTMKSAAKAVVAEEEQQHGSPLPRGRRVSVMSPAAIRMDVEEGEDLLKRDLVKEIVKTPGVALRSTSRRARATPAPLPTPATLRRSTRTAARKAAEPVEAESLVEEEVPTVKRTMRRASARSKMMMDLDQEEEVAAAAPEVQQEEPKAVASDLKFDDPEEEEEEVTKLLDGDNKDAELEEGEEADSSDAANGSALLSDKIYDDRKVEEVADVEEQDATEPQEGPVAEQEPTSVEKSAPLALTENSPILGIVSKGEATVEDGEGAAEWSHVNEKNDEINPVAEDKAVAATEEAIKENGSTITSEIVLCPKQMLPVAAADDETSEEDDLTEIKAGADDETSEEGDLTEIKEGADDEMQQTELAEDETNEEDGLTEGKDGAADEMKETELIEDDTSKISDDEEWTSDDDEATEDNDDEDDEASEERDCTEVSADLNQEKELIQMLQDTAITIEASEDESAEEASEDVSEESSDDDEDDEVSEDGSDEEISENEEATEDGSDEEISENGSAEDDDFSSDLPPEFNNVVVPSETESDTTLPVLEENQGSLTSATKSALKYLDDSGIIGVEEASTAEVSEATMKMVDSTVDNIVKSLDEFTIKEGTKETEELQKQVKFEDFHSKSLRQLKALYKDALNAKEGKKPIVAEGGKRLPLAEVDDNTAGNC